VQRAGDRLQVTAQLLDASSGSDVWSLRLERRMGDIFELQDEISGKVTDAVGVSLAAAPGTTLAQPTPKLDAYLAYIEGRSLLSTFKIADAEQGIERLKRATTIDPNFAAAYAEQAHGLRFLYWLLHTDAPPDPEVEKQAAALNDKALSLDPNLGEAWVERAYGRSQASGNDYDPTTDAQFRKGLALAPNYAQGYERYGEWLHGIGRTDQGLAMIDRARQLDPFAPRNHYMKAIILLEKNADIDQAVPLFLEALRVNPTYHPALARLGQLEGARGNFAEAAKLVERAIALDPRAEWVRDGAALAYLDLGDLAAARDVLAGVSPVRQTQLCLLSYQDETQRGAAVLYALPRADLEAKMIDPDGDWASALIRDDALKRGDPARALRTLQVCVTQDWDPILGKSDGWPRASCAVRYASLLLATGERDRATKLLHSMLTAMQRRKEFMSEDGAEIRGRALALLGDNDAALSALETSYAFAKWGWWYDIDHAPELAALRAAPRFQSLAKQVRDNATRQAALLASMRRAGEVPYRPASQGH